MQTNSLYGGYYLCYTYIFITIMSTYIHIFTYHKKSQKNALVGRQQAPDLGLPPKKHLPETTSCKSELLTVKMGIKVTRLPTRVCHYVYVLNNYIPIPAGSCRSVLLTIYASIASIKSWRVMQPIFSSATYSFPERWFAQIYGSEMKLYVFHQQRIHFHIQTFWLLAWKLRT